MTTPLARRLPRAALPRSRGPAPLRPTCHQAQRLARRSSRPEHAGHSGGPAAGVAGGRGDDLARAQRTKRSEAQRSEAQRRARAAGQFVKRARRSRTRDGHQGLRSPATGRAAVVMTVGAAGLAVLREGWKPVRGETPGQTASPGGSMRSTTARPRVAGPRPPPNQTNDAQLCVECLAFDSLRAFGHPGLTSSPHTSTILGPAKGPLPSHLPRPLPSQSGGRRAKLQPCLIGALEDVGRHAALLQRLTKLAAKERAR